MKEKILSPTYPESVEEGVIANWKNYLMMAMLGQNHE